jgi:hypothetical protein
LKTPNFGPVLDHYLAGRTFWMEVFFTAENRESRPACRQGLLKLWKKNHNHIFSLQNKKKFKKR